MSSEVKDISDMKFRWVLRIIALIILVRMLFDVYYILVQDYGNQNYNAHSGTVVSVSSKKLPKDFWNSQFYTPIIQYEYVVNDRAMFGEKVCMLQSKFMMKADEISLFQSKYNVGDTVDIWLNPNNENESFLLKQYQFSPYCNILFMIFFFCGCVLFQSKSDVSEKHRFVRGIIFNVSIVFVGVACYFHYLTRDGVDFTLKISIGMFIYFGFTLLLLVMMVREHLKTLSD